MTLRHLYVHVPFCGRRCSYCDFSIAVRRATPVAEYLDALRSELVRTLSPYGAAESAPAVLDTLYLGGGTPSRLGGEGVARLLSIVREFAGLSEAAEVTLEANPEDVTLAAVQAWRTAGVNRLSLGAQSFDDDVLRWMHRTHDSAQIEAAVSAARRAGIGNISMDLIFAMPEGLNRSWERDLDHAFALSPEHISLYGLTVEAGTPLGRWVSDGRVTRGTDEAYAEEFLAAHERAVAAGYRHYEVSNFAREELQSRHNLAYWTGAHYLGAGPSAHSYDGQRRWWNIPAYTAWLKALQSGGGVVAGEELLQEESRSAERIYLGLRTSAGYRASDSERAVAEPWTRAGWAVVDGDLLRLNPEGWLRLDALAAGLTGA